MLSGLFLQTVKVQQSLPTGFIASRGSRGAVFKHCPAVVKVRYRTLLAVVGAVGGTDWFGAFRWAVGAD